ncbi:hypothetical protein DV736_g5272, partial [Chaetothyriales sp. CBS 134916]
MSSPAPQSTPAQPPNSRAKQQKLKFACDACARLKISCPKQQPECERCVSRGGRCVYSSACRLGKRKSTQSTAIKTIPSPSSSRIRSSLNSFALSESKTIGTKCSPAGNNSSIAAELPEFPTDNISVHPLDLTNGLPFPATRVQGDFRQPSEELVNIVEPSDTLLHGASPYQELSMFQSQDSDFSPPSVGSTSWPAQRTSHISTSPSIYTGNSSTDSTPWSGLSCSSSDLTGQVETALAIGEALPQLHPVSRESCFTRSCSLLQTLKRPSSQVCIFESGQRSSPQNQHDSTLDSVDKILFNTDRAIEHVSSVIQCQCHTTSSVRHALTLTLFEVIAWYETIVRALNRQQGEKATQDSSPSSSSDEEYDNSDSSSSRTQSESSASEASSMVSIPTVSVGAMRLPQEDAKSVLNLLVRARIDKVRGMVQSLSADCGRSLFDMDELDSVMDACVQNGGQSDDVTIMS